MSVRDRRGHTRTLRALERALVELDRRASTPGVRVLEVQPVIQVCGALGYAAWKTEHERAFRRQGRGWSTRTWPEELGPDMIAGLLLPLAAGRVGLAAGRAPRVIATPGLLTGVPAGTGDRGVVCYRDAVLALMASWACNPNHGFTARLAPPVVEIMLGPRVEERALCDLGLSWHLPAPDGL